MRKNGCITIGNTDMYYAAGLRFRNRFFRYTVISQIPRIAPAPQYHNSYGPGCPSLPEGSLWIH